MEIHASVLQGDLYVRICGEMDEHSAALARKEADKLAENNLQSNKVIFDLSEISFMDSTGIGFLIGRYKKFRRHGILSYIANPSPTTDKILTMSGIYTLIPKTTAIHQSRSQSL